MLVREVLFRFLKKGCEKDEFEGAKFFKVFKEGELVNEFRRNKRAQPIHDCESMDMQVKKIIYFADKWDPKFRVRGYGPHSRNSGIRCIEVYC